MKKILLIIIFFCISNFVYSTEVPSSTIKRLMMDRTYGQKVFIELDTSQTTFASCDTNRNFQYVLDISDDFGKSAYASLLSLYAAGKPVLFRGTGTCTLHYNIETLKRFEAK